MTIDKAYFQGGKDAKYLQGGKETGVTINDLTGKFNRIAEKAYTKDGTELNKNATLPVDVVNLVYDFFVEKVMGFAKDAYGKLSDTGKRYIYNQFKNFYVANKKTGELNALLKAKDKATFDEAKKLAINALANIQGAGLPGGLENLEDALGVAG